MRRNRKNANCKQCGTLMEDVPNGQMHCSVKCKFDSIGYTVNENGCHIWNGTKSSQKSKAGESFPYGGLTFQSKSYAAHVLKCEEAHGPRPSKKHHTLHSCDNPSCCNPEHLRWGTAKENADDREVRNRHSHPIYFDEKASRSTLTNEQYEAIDQRIQKWINDGRPFKNGLKAIAKDLNVSIDIVKNRRRKRFPNYVYAGSFTI